MNFPQQGTIFSFSFSLPLAFMAAILLFHIYFRKGTFLCNSQYYVGYPETYWLDLYLSLS